MEMRFAIRVTSLVVAIGLIGCASPAPSGRAARVATDPTAIPVRQVVLFSSGVGYFEHAGKVKGNADTELRFRTDQINDILKSLLLQDMDGGTVAGVSYPGLAPLSHTLKSFQVDIAANPDMADLLNQLRGAKLTITTQGNQPLSGVIVGVEKKLRAVGDKAVVDEIKLNLKVDRQFRSVLLDQVQSMELDDPALQKELDAALASLVDARDQDKKPMTLHFNGSGERRVRIGYLVETPIWKTSYRLVLGSADVKNKPGFTERVNLTAAGAADEPNHSAKIQGWAIVENQTDSDWNDVQLSLVSGRPLSFIQDLYHSQYLPRPVVQGRNYASLQPQTYAGGISDIKDLVTNIPDFNNAPDFSLQSTSNKQAGAAATQPSSGLFSGGGGGQNGQQPMDPTASILSAATAVRVGELFKYDVGSVSIDRQTSAMIPIVTDDIEAERVSIYNAGVLADHPLLGARLKNNTKKFLLEGPMTVLDHGNYAGDARIEDTPPGQERLISFGIDQQVLVDASEAGQKVVMVTAKIVKGVMTLTSKETVQQTYVADNKSDATRVLIVEQPHQEEFKLVPPTRADETTPELYRFRQVIPPHKSTKFTVVQEHVFDKSTEILPLASDDFAAYANNAAIPQPVRDALAKAIQMKDQILTLNARIADLKKQREELSTDQGRVRQNLQSVPAQSDFYKRLMKKIDDEESDLEKLQKTIAETQQAEEAAGNQLSDYVTGLTVQ